MKSITDYLTGTAADATNAALDTASARPFDVKLSVAPETMIWISLLLIGGVIVYKARKG